MARDIVSVVSSIVSFSNHRPRLESYRLASILAITVFMFLFEWFAMWTPFETQANENSKLAAVLTLYFRVLNDNKVDEIQKDAIGFGDDLPPEGLIM